MIEQELTSKLDTRPTEAISLVHNPFYPAEVYLGEKIEADVTINSSATKTSSKLPVWRISPLGVELLIPYELESKFEHIHPGTPIDIRIKISKQICDFSGLIVASRHKQNDNLLIGVRWCTAPKTSEIFQDDRRGAKRWLCGTDFMPSGIAPNPTRFNDFIHFRVRDISKDGMQLLTSLRNKYLIPGMEIESMLSFPMCAQLSVRLKIKNARITTDRGKEFLSLGVTISNKDPRLMDSIAQYVFQFGPKSTIADLRSSGLNVKHASRGIDFKFVQSDEEYLEVLRLRHLCYSEANKIAKDVPIENLADIYDTRARILVAKHQGIPVGTVRFMFHNFEDMYEHEEHVHLPENMPRKDEVVEVTRLCTHPDYRASDILDALLREMVITMIQTKRRWLLTSAADDLLVLYDKLGVQRMGIRYTNHTLGNIAHEMILVDVIKQASGAGVNPIIWNALFSDMVHYLKEQEISEFDPMMNLRMTVYKLFKPFTPFVIRQIKKRSIKTVT